MAESSRDVVPLNLVELNTMSSLSSDFRDETPRAQRPLCGNWFLLGHGISIEPEVASITAKHLEVCDGDAAAALMKIEQAYKGGWRPKS